MSILKRAVASAEKTRGTATIKSPEVKLIIKTVETFLRSNPLICYGGTAINNILPPRDQFYDTATEFPDYDFYSTDALQDAKRLADIYYKKGFMEVEAKAGVHFGTYKVFVNFLPVADITQIDPVLFDNIGKEAIIVKGIRYAPPNLLRMGMYLELSRPNGDISRWEKVLTRISLLNKHYPLQGDECGTIEFERRFENMTADPDKLYHETRQILIHEKVVFFGGFAMSVYSQHMTKTNATRHRNPDFDVLSTDPETTVERVCKVLERKGFDNIESFEHEGVGEIVPRHIEIRVGGETIAFVYESLACHNYNVIQVQGRGVNIATIDTILSLYLAFTYTGADYYDKRRLICMSEYLFNVQKQNRLSQKGVLRRFSLKCYGVQGTIEESRKEKGRQYELLRKKRAGIEWEQWFLRYVPREMKGRASGRTPARTPKRSSVVRSFARSSVARASVHRTPARTIKKSTSSKRRTVKKRKSKRSFFDIF